MQIIITEMQHVQEANKKCQTLHQQIQRITETKQNDGFQWGPMESNGVQILFRSFNAQHPYLALIDPFFGPTLNENHKIIIGK